MENDKLKPGLENDHIFNGAKLNSVSRDTNYGLVRQQAVDRFRENLKFILLDGATLLTMEELERIVQEVTRLTFNFLVASPKASDGRGVQE